MKPSLIQALKEIAVMGGARGSVPLSSRELAKRLGVSQQTASNRILDLVEEGLIEREMGRRTQSIKVTQRGLDALRSEYADYVRIFEVEDFLRIHGVVTTGLGEGEFYMRRKGYQEQFQRKLWFKPYEGTLNLKITGKERTTLEILRRMDGIEIGGFESEGRTFGPVKTFLATIGDVECAVVMPLRSHHTDVLEVISKHHLRSKLGLRDGDIVELVVRL